MRENLKKPNFTLAEQHAQGYSQKYYGTTNANANLLAHSVSEKPDPDVINNRRLDARASHFKVGF
jgi:hypothetical protein